jgi:hypothetical protein
MGTGMAERVATEGPDEPRKLLEVHTRVGPAPARNGIVGEGQRHHGDDGGLVG